MNDTVGTVSTSSIRKQPDRKVNGLIAKRYTDKIHNMNTVAAISILPIVYAIG